VRVTMVDRGWHSCQGLRSRAGEVKKDLTDEECQGGCVQAVSWSPTRDEFILISGFQPAKATLYIWDEKAKKVSSKKTLLDKAHRNTIRYNSFGSLVCLAGFGNLAGGVDFFGRDEDDYVHVASCTANCTVSAEWAPDGRHFLTAVLAPRMRVDNAINVWSGLSGSKVCTTPFEELFDVQWRPLPDSKYTDVTKEEIVAASKEDAKNVVEAGAQKKQAYRPPKARGETSNTVAQMMRGEVAAPEDDRRTRKARQQRPKDEEAAGPDDSKEDGQTDSPPSRPPPPEAPPPPAARAQQAQAQQQAQQAQQQVQQAQQQAQQREAQAREAQRMREMQNAAKAANAAQLDRQRQVQEAQEAAQEQIVRDMLNLQRAAGGADAANAAAALRLQAHHAAQAKKLAQAQQIAAAGHQRQQQQQQQPMQNMGASAHGQKQACPATGWQYIDPKNQIQGPFSLLEMQQWYHMNYFRPELKMRLRQKHCSLGCRLSVGLSHSLALPYRLVSSLPILHGTEDTAW
ncbi:eif-2A, partial [Symbiodinium sp. KB8]